MSRNSNDIREGRAETALVVGVNGQDGGYLAKHLHSAQKTVFGIGRQCSAREDIGKYLMNYMQIDVTQTTKLEKALREIKPDVIFYTAAIHGPSGFRYENVWLSAHQVNTLGLHSALEYARQSEKKVRVVYFSSAKVFELLGGHEIAETSSRVNSCIYSITKNTSEYLVNYYRQEYGIDASVIWMFNHESEHRKSEFFVKKIAESIRLSLQNKRHVTEVETLDFWCDWGAADEFMLLLVKYYKILTKDNYILATGNTVWARDVVTEAFRDNELDVNQHITTRISSVKNLEAQWNVNINKFRSKTNDFPKISGVDVFYEVLRGLRG